MTDFTDNTIADLSAMFTAVGDDATYTPGGGSASSIKVIFSKDHAPVDADGVAVEAYSVFARAITTDVPNAADGDTLTVQGKTYNVRYVRDGEPGETILVLSED